MSRQLFSLRNLNRNERGVYLMIVAASAFVLLAIVGWAIDSASLYWTKSELQRAVDAAALSGARILIRDQGAGYTGADNITDRVLSILAENLRLSNFTQDEIDDATIPGRNNVRICFNKTRPDDVSNPCETAPSSPSLQRRYIWVGTRVNHRSLILGLIPGFAKTSPVPAIAFAENLALEVVLVLDTTGSMAQTISGDSHNKMYYLKQAANGFVGKLLPFDKVGIVTFAIAGTAGSYTPDSITREPTFNLSNPGAVFNPIRAAYEDDSQSILLPPLNPVQQIIDAGGNHVADIQARIDSMSANGTTNLGSGLWRGRELLNSLGPVADNTWRMLVFMTDGSPNTYIPVTWMTVGDRPLHNPPVSVCNNSQFLPLSPVNADRLREIDAIKEADLARDSNYSVYSIGVGDEDMDRTSPFQNLASDNMKWALMQRIANDQTAMAKPSPTPNWTVPTPSPPYLWDFPCVPDGNALKSKPEGTFWLAKSGSDLVEAFEALTEVRTKLGDAAL